MKLLTVVGARPNFIKLAPLDRELRKEHTCITVHTGQHFDDNMCNSFFREFGIAKPNYDLNVSNTSGDATQATQTGEMMIAVDPIFVKENPDLAIVYGDTNSSLAGALVAAKRNVPIAHIEAGCRSWDMTMPEEVNRVIIDHVSTLLFCPTRTAEDILRHEKYGGSIVGAVYNTGDVMADVLDENLMRAREESNIIRELDLLDGKRFAVLTLHRPSNVDDPKRLVSILTNISLSGVRTIFPVHPRTRKHLWDQTGFGNITLIHPVSYRDMLLLMDRSSVIITDSGGVQKEAYILKKPCLTIRNTTEWPETLAYWWNRLVKDIDRLPELVREAEAPTLRPQPEPFPTGASRRIAQIIRIWGAR